MKITFRYKREENLHKYLYVAHGIQTGFYQRLQLYILPYLPNKSKSRTVYFPDIHEFTRSFGANALITGWRFLPRKTMAALNQHIIQREKTLMHVVRKLEASFGQALPEFIPFLLERYPQKSCLNIDIYPTWYGTRGSFKNSRNFLSVTPRFDSTVCGLSVQTIHQTHYIYGTRANNVQHKSKILKNFDAFSPLIQFQKISAFYIC